MYDDFLFHLLKDMRFKDTEIIITSSMGQKAAPSFDDKLLAPYDGKIVDMDLFLDVVGFVLRRALVFSNFSNRQYTSRQHTTLTSRCAGHL